MTTDSVPAHNECDGGIFCKVSGHVTVRDLGNGRRRFSHIKLTRSQQSAIRERRGAERRGSK